MKKSLTETIIEELKISILSGEYKSGEKLPTLRELRIMHQQNPDLLNSLLVFLPVQSFAAVRLPMSMVVTIFRGVSLAVIL